MIFIIGLLTVALVLDCVALIGLVLIQLPKKDTGGGLAFGGGASDALFGAGSGNVMTKITKYAATIFFTLAVVLAIMQRYNHERYTSSFTTKLQQAGSLPGGLPAAPSTEPASATRPAAAPFAGTNGTTTNAVAAFAVEATNLPAPTATNSVPAPAAPK